MSFTVSEIKNMQRLRRKSQERRMNAVQEFSDRLNDKLGDKVKVVAAWGSVPKGKHGYDSDIDTLVILDDTKLENDVPGSAKNKIQKKVTGLAKKVDPRITIQYFPFLTEFWDSLRKGEPLAVEAIRNGDAVYDTGIFMPAKRLLQRGKIESSQESVKKRLKAAAAGYKKAEKKMKKIPHKLEQVMANGGQAPIMLLGRNAPPKEKVPDMLEEMFVENDMLEQEYVEKARELYEFGDTGEKESEKITGQNVQEHLDIADDYVRRMHKLVSQVRTKNRVDGIYKDYKKFLKANVAMLKEEGIEPPEDREDLPDIVEEELDLEESELELFSQWNEVMEEIRDENMEDVNRKQLHDLREKSRSFVSGVGRDLKSKKASAEDITPDLDADSVAQAAAGEDIIPNLEEKAEEQVEDEGSEEENED